MIHRTCDIIKLLLQIIVMLTLQLGASAMSAIRPSKSMIMRHHYLLSSCKVTCPLTCGRKFVIPRLRRRLLCSTSIDAMPFDDINISEVPVANNAMAADLLDSDTSNLQHLKAGNIITEYWIKKLSQLPHGTARNLVPQLVPGNVVGYEGVTGPAKSGSLVGYYINQKIEHPDKIILMRNGEFYETFGIDSIMLIAYCGLNPMGGKPKAGCPIQNVQATLDGLTGKGFTVAVYEEITPPTDQETTSKAKMKTRGLSQIVFPGSKTYLHNLSLRQDNIEFPENFPVVGIMNTVGGYIMCQIYLDKQIIDVSERLTLETVRVLAMGRHIQPIYLQGKVKKDILGADIAYEVLNNFKEKDFPEQVLRHFASSVLTADIENFKKRKKSYSNGARPVYISTALQIGLIPNPNVPPLVPQLLPKRHSALSADFLRNWISHPPSHDLADHMRELCLHLLSISAPQCKSLQIEKVVSLLWACEGNLSLFRDIKDTMTGVLNMLLSAKHFEKKQSAGVFEVDLRPLLPHLQAITTAETGLDTYQEILAEECSAVLKKMSGVIATEEEAAADSCTTDGFNGVPNEFFTKHEELFRGRLSRKSPTVDAMYRDIERKASALITAVEDDFPPLSHAETKFDVLNNLICFTMVKKTVPRRGKSTAVFESSKESSVTLDPDTETDEYEFKKKNHINAVDRKNKPMSTKYTTDRVSKALDDYLAVTEKSITVTGEVLKELSANLYTNVNGIKQAAAWSIILNAASEHAASACQRGWCIPELLPLTPHGQDPSVQPSINDDVCVKSPMKVSGLSPYWIDRSTAALNDFELHGIFLLTAPNMSGKSTLMRSILVAALLANCGLFVPCSKAQVPRYDHFFLRTSSHDVPSEGKSAFALEMEDMRIVLEDSSPNSLIMIDELGKGTSARDGAALAGALLESLDLKNVSGIFATHLHELLLLPLYLPNTKHRRMGFNQETGGRLQWTYKLLEGSCTNSHALETAHTYGIDIEIINRAQRLGTDFDHICRPTTARGDVAKNIEATVDRKSSREGSGGITDNGDKGVNYEDINKDIDKEISPTYQPLPRSKGSLSRYEVEDISAVFWSHLKGNVMSPKMDLVPHEQHPPPSYEGKSCVYLLVLQRSSQPDSVYVGETESIRQRLQDHRLKFKGKGVVIVAIVTSVSNKSYARRLESQVQKLLKERGYGLESDTDSRHTLFGASMEGSVQAGGSGTGRDGGSEGLP